MNLQSVRMTERTSVNPGIAPINQRMKSQNGILSRSFRAAAKFEHSGDRVLLMFFCFLRARQRTSSKLLNPLNTVFNLLISKVHGQQKWE